MLIVGFFLVVAFVVWESYWPHPLMPLHIWKDRNFTLVSLQSPSPPNFLETLLPNHPLLASLHCDSRNDVFLLLQLLACSYDAGGSTLGPLECRRPASAPGYRRHHLERGGG